MTQVKLGYDDTPLIPGSKYKVHDNERPQPAVITPPTESSQTAPGKPPSDAMILFDGTSLSGWTGKDGVAAWKVEKGYMEVVPGTGNIQTRDVFGNCQLHVEWAAPEVVKGESQGRGNSGVFLMGLYEIQVLDCYDNPTYADGSTAGIYGQFPPMVNACRKPGKWQIYDIVWVGPKFKNGKLASPARLTLLHNGILVHHNRELTGPTTHRAVLEYKTHALEGPLVLQDHGDLVRFRNIWYRPLACCCGTC